MGAFATFSPVNTPALLSGTEYEGYWQSMDHLVRITVSHMDLFSENLSNAHSVRGKKLPYRPQNTSKMSVLLTPGKLSLEYSVRWIGSRFVTEANTVRLPGYRVHDLTLGLALRYARATHTLKASLFNMTDERYEMVENAPLPGREWRLAWEISRL
jgi:outer membrane cobalamin receptor